MNGGTVAVTVVWATRDVQDVVPLTLAAGATVADAIAQSGLVARYRIDRAAIRVGIHGRLAREDTVLADGDRIEIYRPLTVDPKETRRLRAEVKARGRAKGRPAP